MGKIAALVVTYNRKELLEECVTCILNQTYPVDKIIIINNQSTDGTELLFEEGGALHHEKCELITMRENLGGAGGFSAGMKLIAKMDYDWVWIMDDDSMPTETALEELVKAKENLKDEKIGYLASAVFGVNDEPINVPVISPKKSDNGYADWYRHLDEGIVKIRHATFVSLLIPVDAVRKIGAPAAEYFIWADDTEYTQRLGRYYGDGWFCGRSRVIHKCANTKNMSVIEENNPNRINNYRYFYRNSLINAKKYNPPGNSALHVVEYAGTSLKCLLGKDVKYRKEKFLAIHKGIIDYLFHSREIRDNLEETIRNGVK